MKTATKYNYQVKHEELKRHKDSSLFIDVVAIEPVYRDAIEGADLAEEVGHYTKRKDCPVGLKEAYENYQRKTK